MRKLSIALLLLATPVLGQEAPPLEPETVHSTALRLTLDFETINSFGGWFPAGSRPLDYEMGPTTTEGMIRPTGFRIQARPDASREGFGTLMRWAAGVPWRGKRLQLSARMKGENVDRLQLWLRADSSAPAVVAFYNMDDRPVRGTSDWRRYTVVLDIPEEAQRLAFGFFVLGGRGTGWAEDFHVEEVGREVPVSRMPSPSFQQAPSLQRAPSLERAPRPFDWERW